MQDHYLYQVIKVLDKADYEAFGNQLKEGKKERSKALLKLIRACDKNTTKADLYTKLFRNKYTAERDYLIRNEFRLLKKALEKYLVEKEALAELSVNEEWRKRLLANAMVKYQLSQIATGYFTEAKEAAIFNLHYDLAMELNMSMVSLQYRSTMQLEDMGQMINANAEVNKQLLQDAAAFRAAQIQFQQILAQRISKHTEAGVDLKVTSAATFVKQLPLADNKAAEFYLHKAQAYSTYSIADMEMLVALAQQLPQNPLIRNERITAVVQLGSICSMKGQFEKADELFRSVYLTDDLKDLKEKTSFYINYVRNLTKLKKYAEALAVTDEAETVVLEMHMRNLLETSRITCYLFLKDTAKLKEYLPNDFATISDHLRAYYKLLYAIYFYLNNQLPIAIRELENLLSTKHVESSGSQETAHLMLAVFRIVEKDGLGKLSKPAAQKAATLIKTDKQKLPVETQNMLPMLWLEECFGGG